ncbi:MAG: RluA family pseudouridine synthase [Candidatus Omnitrophota bacterium]
MQEYILKVSAEDSDKRLDVFIVDFSKQNKLGFSRQYVQRLILDGGIGLKKHAVSLNDELTDAVVKAHYKVKEGDEIVVRIEDKKTVTLQPENIPLNIVYEDQFLAVINKPAGLVVHPAPGNYEHTLVNALLFQFKELSDINPQRPGIVHRLDKETSGLLVIAKNNDAHLALTRQFSSHTIKREYVALVKGKMEFDENIIELPIGRHPYKRKNMAVGFSQNSKYAKTFYRTIKRANDASMVELKPFTGRTHQLRVHLAFIGHPILGDTKYGKNNTFNRLALHAKSIAFIHPHTAKLVEFSCDMPKEFEDFWKSTG